METIRIKGLEIFAYHGVNPEEKENGQKFILDIAMQADISRAAQTEDLNETVNYAAVRKRVNAARHEFRRPPGKAARSARGAVAFAENGGRKRFFRVADRAV